MKWDDPSTIAFQLEIRCGISFSKHVIDAFLWSIFACRRNVISNLQPPFYFELIGLEENGRKAHIRAGLRERYQAA